MVTDIYGVPHLVFFIGIRDPSHLQGGQVPIGLFMSEESPWGKVLVALVQAPLPLHLPVVLSHRNIPFPRLEQEMAITISTQEVLKHLAVSGVHLCHRSLWCPSWVVANLVDGNLLRAELWRESFLVMP